MANDCPMTKTGRHSFKPIYELSFEIVPDVGRWVKTQNLKRIRQIGRSCWLCHRTWG